MYHAQWWGPSFIPLADGSTLSTRNSRLFGSFIFSCGVAHALMFAFMLFMAWRMEHGVTSALCAELRDNRYWWSSVIVWAIIAQSWQVAAVSWEAALRLRLRV